MSKEITFSVDVTFWENGEPIKITSTKFKKSEEEYNQFVEKISGDGPELKNLSFIDNLGMFTTIPRLILERSLISIWKYSEKEK